MPKLKLHTQILLGMAIGVILGMTLGEKATLLAPVGKAFISLLKMLIMPLILASIVTGIVSIGDTKNLGRLGAKTLVYYLTTTFLATFIGLAMVNLVKPGVGMLQGGSGGPPPAHGSPPSLLSIIMGMIPSNIFRALAQDKVLSTILFSILLGSALNATREKSAPLIDLFEAFNEVMMKLTQWIMALAPLGVLALMATTVGKVGLSVFRPLALYMATVVAGLGIHACIVLPLLLEFLGRVPLRGFFKSMVPALATAFSTASSAATMPLTMECLEKKARIPNQVVSFVIPLGATVNMDGTALYEAVAAIFIAQAYGVHLTLPQQLTVSLTATLASIGAAAIPGAGLVTMVIVLKAVNLPLEGIGMILAVDRILDMCRTTVNVWGDACGSAIVARLEGLLVPNPSKEEV